MNYRIIPQKHFLKELKRLAKKYHSLKQDLQALQNELSSNPSAGIDLGCGIRKIRMAIGSKTKEKVMAHESSPIPIPLMIPKGLSTSFIFMIRKSVKVLPITKSNG